MDQIQIATRSHITGDYIDIYIHKVSDQEFPGRYPGHFKANITWEEVDANGIEENPTFNISNTHAQALMDRLWDCGVRPTERKGSPDSLAAVKWHLQRTNEYADWLMILVEKLISNPPPSPIIGEMPKKG